MPTRKKTQVSTASIKEELRKTHELDATGMAVGRLATAVATLLTGKNKPNFVSHIDGGDYVIVNNASKVKFTGKKLVQKDYYHHTMHPGGIKRMPMAHLFAKDPGEVVRKAVNGMIPKNKHREVRMSRLTINS